jgi:mono/diheme cytochrome c family protein
MMSVGEILSMKMLSRAARHAAIGALTMMSVVACVNDEASRATPGDTAPAKADSSAPSSGVAVPPAGASAGSGEATAGVSVVTGVFTVAQATRGGEVYAASCAQCHTMAQHSGGGFAAAWNGRRLVDLYEIIRGTMPLDNPGGLSDQEYIDVVAYMLQLNGVPAGKAPLPADAAVLRDLRIEVKPTGE